jgi:hypothetical protein
MRLEEGMNLAHRQGNSLLGFFPGEHAHLGLWREHRVLHGPACRAHDRDPLARIIAQVLFRLNGNRRGRS